MMFCCPYCGYFGVHTAFKTTIDRVRKEGSEKAPLRAFCTDPNEGSCQGKRHGKPTTSKTARGRVQVRLISNEANHIWAMLPVNRRKELEDLASQLNLCLFHGSVVTKESAMKVFDSSYGEGMRAPKAFRRIGGY